MAKEKNKKIQIRLMADLMDRLKDKARLQQMSLNGYLSFVLNDFAGKKEVLFEEITRPLSKLASGRKFEGDEERKTGAYLNVREDLSTESTYKLPAEVEFRRGTIKGPEKKTVESRLFFTQSEAELLRKYAELNGWSMTKEIRFRTISTLAKKPKLNAEELASISKVRSSINILGANLNRLIREEQVLSDHNIDICQELISLIKQLRSQIEWLAGCSNSRFRITG